MNQHIVHGMWKPRGVAFSDAFEQPEADEGRAKISRVCRIPHVGKAEFAGVGSIDLVKVGI